MHHLKITTSAACAALTLCTAQLAAQDSFTSVPSSVLSTIGEIMPERSNANMAYVSDTYSPNVIVTADATIDVILVWEGAGYQNSIGYFTYRDESNGSVTILSSDLIEANVSFPGAGSLQTGDRYTLKDAGGQPRVFQDGDKVGFFIVADGNRRSSEVSNWTFSMAGVPSTDPNANRQIGRGLYTSLSQLNPENLWGEADLARHLAMVWMPGEAGFLDGDDYLLCGFEDLNRAVRSDDDFNDCVFIVTATPIAALGDTEAQRYQGGDPDNDGVDGINDQFPDDPDRAVIQRIPSSGLNVLAFEDSYPEVGDADYNDAVFAYYFEVVTNADGDVKDILGNFTLVARGATYDAGLGLHIPGLPSGATGSVSIERFLSDGSNTHEVITDRTVAQFIAAGNRVEDIFSSTTAALPPATGEQFTNTLYDPSSANGASARFLMTFDSAVDASLLGNAPYDLFLAINRYGNGVWDIHLPGFDSFSDRSTHLPTETGAGAFVDSNGFPWALEVPSNWRYPMERVHVGNGYNSFTNWRTSGGAQSTNWYLSPNSGSGQVSAPLADIVPVRTWTVKISGT